MFKISLQKQAFEEMTAKEKYNLKQKIKINHCPKLINCTLFVFQQNLVFYLDWIF